MKLPNSLDHVLITAVGMIPSVLLYLLVDIQNPLLGAIAHPAASAISWTMFWLGREVAQNEEKAIKAKFSGKRVNMPKHYGFIYWDRLGFQDFANPAITGWVICLGTVLLSI